MKPKIGGALFDDLRKAAAVEWAHYVDHPFVSQLGQGTLPERAFRHYLAQDYLFLVHFARAYALAVYKADDLDDMRQAGDMMTAILNVEMGLHVDYCASWGLDEAAMQQVPEDPATVAYTRFVLDRGMAGDLLDLHVALAPCVVGYAEIGSRLAADGATSRSDHPYEAWVEMYAGVEYQSLAEGQTALLDRLYEKRAGAGRRPRLIDTFRAATRLEADFWQMALDAAN